MNKTYFSDCEEIVTAVKKFLEANNKGDASIMKPYFHKDAVVFWGGGNTDEFDHGIKVFFDLIDASGPDPEKHPHYHIDILDLTETIAVVKIAEEWQGKTYTNYLTFIKTAEGWKITAKIFHTHTGNDL